MTKKKIMAVLGTRPEVIKMAPVILELRKVKGVNLQVCVTAQHREMLDQALKLFDIEPDIDLNLMRPNQSLSSITSSVLVEMDKVLKNEKPDIVLVQGDTTTAMATSVAAFYSKIDIGHIEAGLRSLDINSPFPEEFNRKVISLITKYHFAPTEKAKETLIKEGYDRNSIYVTGNTVIDALFLILQTSPDNYVKKLLSRIEKNQKIILVTAHRRENFGGRLESICRGLKNLVERNKDIVIIYPVHFNPNVRKTVFGILKNVERILLTNPLEYNVLVHLMNVCYLILTDSGGIQEEAPSLGKPVLVMRTETERPEGIKAGTAKLIGPYEGKIISETEKLLYNKVEYNRMAKAVNPYGDGKAAKRIAEILLAGGTYGKS